MMNLSRLADGFTIVVAVVILGVIGARFIPNERAPVSIADATIDGQAVGIDFAAAERTLVMVLQSDCPFCERSVPFYERLPRGGAAQIVIAAPLGDTDIESYRKLIEPDELVFVEPGTLPVSGTPTLLLVDGEGRVDAAWIGVLDSEREAEVLDALGGKGARWLAPAPSRSPNGPVPRWPARRTYTVGD